MANVEVRGMDRLNRVLDQAADMPPTLMRGLEQFIAQRAWHVAGEAQKRTPLDTGTLMRSAMVEVDLRGIGSATASVLFGGNASAYAEVQHEREDFEHPRGGQAHFLHGRPNSAWEQNREAVRRDIETKVKEVAEAVLALGL